MKVTSNIDELDIDFSLLSSDECYNVQVWGRWRCIKCSLKSLTILRINDVPDSLVLPAHCAPESALNFDGGQHDLSVFERYARPY